MGRAGSRTRLRVVFAAVWPVEENLGHKILGEVRKAMYLAGGGEQDIAPFKDNRFRSAEVSASPAGDDVNLIADMRLLGVGAQRRVHLDCKRSVPKQFGKALAVGSWKAFECVGKS